MDFIQNLRMRQMFPVEQFPNYGAQPPTPEPMPEPVQQPYNAGARMNEIYQPQTEATDRFNALVQNQPQYENPSFLRTIGAALSAFGPGGHQTGDKVMNFHNNLNQQEWKNQLVPAQQAADNERAENINSRTLAHQTVSSELAARVAADKDKNNIEVNKTRLIRAKAYQFKTEHPGMKLVFTPGGNIIAHDPNNPTHVITLTDDDGNPIPSGKLSDTDKANLSQKNELERIDAKTAGNVEVEGAKQGGREQLAETRGWKVGSIPDPNDPSKQIGVQYNEVTGEVKPVKFGDQNPVITKPGTASATTGNNVGLQKIQNQARDTLTAIDDILDDKTGKLTPHAADAVGPSRAFGLQYLPGTQTKRGDVAINHLKSRMIVDLIAEMKAQSKTGSTGFGALNLRELGVLETAASKLDPALDEESFTAEVQRIKDKLKLILQSPTGNSNTVTNAPKPPPDTDALIRKYTVPK